MSLGENGGEIYFCSLVKQKPHWC